MRLRISLLSLHQIFLFITVNFISSLCYANHNESFKNIESTVKQFVTSQIDLAPDETLEVKISQAGTPFNVPICSKEMEPTLAQKAPVGQQISTVELSCNGTQPWHLYIPVDVQVFKNVLAAKHTIPAKETITENDVDYVLTNKNRLYHGYFVKKNEIVGTVALHTIRAGSILTKKSLHLPIIVQKNQGISLVAKSNMITVSMAGVAKTDGTLNSLIKVFNPSSKRTIDAIVIGPNKAQVVN